MFLRVSKMVAHQSEREPLRVPDLVSPTGRQPRESNPSSNAQGVSQELIQLGGQFFESTQSGFDRFGAGHVDSGVAKQVQGIFAAPG